MENPQQIEARVEARHRIILIIWFALLMSISIFFAMTRYIPGNNTGSNAMLSYALIAGAFTLVVASVWMKQRYLQRAIEKRDPAIVQSGYILSFALSESAALWGLCDHFVTGSKYYFVSFLIALLGMLLHFPRKDHLRAAM